LDGATFAGSAWFRDAEFASDALCEGAEFIGDVGFVGVGLHRLVANVALIWLVWTVGLPLIVWHVQDLVSPIAAFVRECRSFRVLTVRRRWSRRSISV
jgi:hypothetical protein